MKFSKIKSTTFFLLIIMLIGTFFRFYNLNWDRGYFFNPDESNNIAIPAANLKPPYKPSQFVYGSLTIYLYRLCAAIVAFFTKNRQWLNADRINIIGRFISATISTSLIFLVYYLGKKLYSKKIGLLASLFTSYNVGLIQAAHFGTTETIITFGGILIAIAAIRILDEKKYPLGYILAGLSLGLTAGAKLSALVFLPPFFLSHLLSLSKKNFVKRTLFFLETGVLLITVFLITCPYSILNFKAFKDSFLFQQSVASGKVKCFFIVQFQKTAPYLFQIKNVFPYILGFPVLVFGILGFVFILYQSKKILDRKKLLFIFIPAFYFLYNGSLFVKWTRYMIPLAPFFCLLAAIFLIELHRKTKLFATFLILLTVFLQFFYALGFFNIYKQPDTRIKTSEWIYENIPKGATLLLEPLDVVALPLSLNNLHPNTYNQKWFDFYGLDDYSDTNSKLQIIVKLSDQLAGSDYFISGSRRIYADRLRLKNNFPLTARYYTLLFNGNLGFRKIKEISSYPKIPWFEINDDKAEETFQVFDHPKVLIFQNINRLTAAQIANILR